MNMLKKLSVVGSLGVLAMVSGASASASNVSMVALPDLSAATAAVDKMVAADMTAQMRAALNAPRETRVRRSPSVFISEGTEMIVVKATRLPPIDGIDSPQPVRTAQVRL